MSLNYYASFVIHQPGAEHVTQYSGVVELSQKLRRELSTQELARMLANNLDVDAGDVEVLQWGLIH